MPALSTSRKTATLAALLITGGATTAIAQMVANADAQADAQRARAAAMAVCDTIRDDAERTGCRAARSIQFDEQRIAKFDASIAKSKAASAEHQKAAAEHQKAAEEHRRARQQAELKIASITTNNACFADAQAITSRANPQQLEVLAQAVERAFPGRSLDAISPCEALPVVRDAARQFPGLIR